MGVRTRQEVPDTARDFSVGREREGEREREREREGGREGERERERYREIEGERGVEWCRGRAFSSRLAE